jgi:Flagellar basal body-associated protein
MAEVEEAPKKGGGLLKILIFVFAGILLIVVGLGIGFFMFGSNPNDPNAVVDKIMAEEMAQQEAEQGESAEGEGEEDAGPKKISKDSKKEEVYQTLYYEFPAPLTTNLQGSRRFLQIGIGVSTQYDETVVQNVEAHLPGLKHALLAAMSDYTEEMVQGREARQALADDLKNVINMYLEEMEGFGGVEGVHFTTYIMQ